MIELGLSRAESTARRMEFQEQLGWSILDLYSEITLFSVKLFFLMTTGLIGSY